MEKQKFYITTAIAYLNGSPHLGHALEIIQADCVARFYRILGRDLVFQTGSDEHGIKIYSTAQKKNENIESLIEKFYKEFIDLYKKLNISHDRFIRTTDQKHKRGASKLWNELNKKGDIYKSNYIGNYCVGCESYKTINELEDGKCPYHPNRELLQIKEENYFFKLSKYAEKLIEIYENDEIQIYPKKRKAEIISFLKGGVEDISFSRQKKNLPWGIPVPDDNKHVMYVWADALSNYITNIGYEYDPNEFKKIWPADIHLIGKDIIKFHAVYWPAMLISANIELPKKLYVHGFITVEGSKIGKSLGNTIDPFILIDKYGTDPFRFHLLKNISTYEDGSFSENDLIQTYNNTLADDLGNLILRILTFIERDFKGEIPELFNTTSEDDEFLSNFDFIDELVKFFDKFQINKAIDRIWEFVKQTNKYVNDRAPWNLKKNNEMESFSTVLYILIEALRIIAIYIKPFIPSISNKITKLIGIEEQQEFRDIIFKSDRKGKIGKKEVLFPKLSEIETKQKSEEPSLISYDEFKKLDIRIAIIEKAERIPKADNLYKLNINIGTEKRTIVGGLAKYYKPEELLGKKIVVLINLQPRKVRGVLSQGMLLAAVDGKNLAVLVPDKEVPPGAKIE